ncbi:phage holin family protein [Gimesia aquarii]|uniref:Uncharacterized protein n=1 Tax=Gimesia aquarii TaxID=2527964 RepID=A0A517WX60_9PLAN|nr:phage holin family protein [Gimesia aquarii]QDU09819.1 hypothetical protein V202x_32160 [Gimesia aquarii]
MNERNGQPKMEQASNMKSHLGDLGADLITLSELQLELIAVDTRDATREATYPAILACLALGVALGVCPVALLGLSWWLSDFTELSQAASSLIAASIGMLIAASLFFFAWKGFKQSFTLLKRSRTELQSNIQWIKKILSEKHRYHQEMV